MTKTSQSHTPSDPACHTRSVAYHVLLSQLNRLLLADAAASRQAADEATIAGPGSAYACEGVVVRLFVFF